MVKSKSPQEGLSKLDFGKISSGIIILSMAFLFIAGVTGALTLGVGNPIIPGAEKIGTIITAGGSIMSIPLLGLASYFDKMA